MTFMPKSSRTSASVCERARFGRGGGEKQEGKHIKIWTDSQRGVAGLFFPLHLRLEQRQGKRTLTYKLVNALPRGDGEKD